MKIKRVYNYRSHQELLKIGTVTIKEGETVTRHFECAAWYEEILLTPGRYDVTTDGNYVFYTVPGTILEDNFQSYFGGVAFGKGYDTDQTHGNPPTYTAVIDNYCVASAIFEGRGNIELLPEYSAKEHHFTYEDLNGIEQPLTIHYIDGPEE